MKKEFVITNVETIAFDDQIVTMKAPDATIKMHLHDQTQHTTTNDIGKTVAFEIVNISASSSKKKVAKKTAKKTAVATVDKKKAVATTTTAGTV